MLLADVALPQLHQQLLALHRRQHLSFLVLFVALEEKHRDRRRSPPSLLSTPGLRFADTGDLYGSSLSEFHFGPDGNEDADELSESVASLLTSVMRRRRDLRLWQLERRLSVSDFSELKKSDSIPLN